MMIQLFQHSSEEEMVIIRIQEIVSFLFNIGFKNYEKNKFRSFFNIFKEIFKIKRK